MDPPFKYQPNNRESACCPSCGQYIGFERRFIQARLRDHWCCKSCDLLLQFDPRSRFKYAFFQTLVFGIFGGIGMLCLYFSMPFWVHLLWTVPFIAIFFYLLVKSDRVIESNKSEETGISLGWGRVLLGIFAVIGIFITSFAWNIGIIPIASGPARAKIRHALDLKILPTSIRVNNSGNEVWTDYTFEADCKISPQQFEKLLLSRKFKQTPATHLNEKTTSAYLIRNYTGFEIDTAWRWQGEHQSICSIFANKDRDRFFIRYMSD